MFDGFNAGFNVLVYKIAQQEETAKCFNLEAK